MDVPPTVKMDVTLSVRLLVIRLVNLNAKRLVKQAVSVNVPDVTTVRDNVQTEPLVKMHV